MAAEIRTARESANNRLSRAKTGSVWSPRNGPMDRAPKPPRAYKDRFRPVPFPRRRMLRCVGVDKRSQEQRSLSVRRLAVLAFFFVGCSPARPISWLGAKKNPETIRLSRLSPDATSVFAFAAPLARACICDSRTGARAGRRVAGAGITGLS